MYFGKQACHEVEKKFQRRKVNLEKLLSFNFQKEGDFYRYEEKFMDREFLTIIKVNEKGEAMGNVFEMKIGEEYKHILKKIGEACFAKEYFVFPRANQITTGAF